MEENMVDMIAKATLDREVILPVEFDDDALPIACRFYHQPEFLIEYMITTGQSSKKYIRRRNQKSKLKGFASSPLLRRLGSSILKVID